MTELQSAPCSSLNNDELEYKIEKATETLDRNIGFITNCDNKTSIVLSAIGVLLTIILTNDGLISIYNIICSCINEKNFCSVLYLICFALVLAVLFLGLYNLVSVLIARLSIKDSKLDSNNSKIFFEGISKIGKYEIYRTEFYKMDKQQYLDELIGEIYTNAEIAVTKYKKYNIGLKLSIIGFLSFVFIILIGLYIY